MYLNESFRRNHFLLSDDLHRIACLIHIQYIGQVGHVRSNADLVSTTINLIPRSKMVL
jgi:hypothetical protein